jgi:hypothetical protein
MQENKWPGRIHVRRKYFFANNITLPMLELSDAIVIVVIVLLLYYVLFKCENFDLKADVLPIYGPLGWQKSPEPARWAWIKDWTSNLTNAQRVSFNNKMSDYALAYYRGSLATPVNLGAPATISRLDFIKYYTAKNPADLK